MSIKRSVSILLAAALVGSLFGASGALAGKKKKKAKPGPVTVGVDPEGDWNGGGDGSEAGDLLGQDLTEAVIAMDGKDTINFVIHVTSLPPTGGWPEVTRYVWDFNVDGEFVELDGKFTNYSRGACDPTSGQCPPPRDPGMSPFLVRGNCGTDPNASNVTVCEEIGVVQAIFDAAEGTITIPLPLELIGAKPGSKIYPDANLFGGSVAAVPSAFVSSTGFPTDSMFLDKTFQVPGKAKKGKKR